MDIAMPGDNVVVVILAGGAGERLWPLSTPERPKQFVRLKNRSFLQLAYDRAAQLTTEDRVMVVTNKRYVDQVYDELGIPRSNIIGEPEGRDTAGAIGLALALIQKKYGNAIVVVLTSDHVIEPMNRFRASFKSAIDGVHSSRLTYTFGIKPTCPATGYGYLEFGDVAATSMDGLKHYNLKSFKEKPNEAVAKIFFDSGRYLWNSGMFVWSCDTMWKAFETHLPDHARILSEIARIDVYDPQWESHLSQLFPQLPKISIDHGIMEKIPLRMMVGDFTWDDVGSWEAMAAYCDKVDGNAVRGRVTTLDTFTSLVYCEDESEQVAVMGLDDVVVVRSGKRTLVVDRALLGRMKDLVRRLC